MNIGDKVIIGGRTMLRPGVSLVGLQARVMPSVPNVPPGCTTLLIDWAAQGYSESGDLPSLVNVPTSHLELDDENVAANIELPRLSPGKNAKTQRPILGLVRDENVIEEVERADEPSEINDASQNEIVKSDAQEDDDSESESPRLRLI